MIGVRLGSWIIEEEIGRGGMGTVYRARRNPAAEAPAEIAAIKVLAAELAVELGFQQRFQREIDILRKLEHPGIVGFYESGVQNGRYWFAMEYVDGASCEQVRGPRGRLPWREVLELACQIAPALKHAHDRGVIHRDLKPGNLLRVHGSEVVKLSDFGISSLFASPHLTVTGGVIGTPEFLSPEQAAGKPITRRSDLYSLGVVLYTLVTGNTPFTGDPVNLLHKHQFGQYERPSRLVPDLHPDFEEIIANLLEKDPGKRSPDAGVLFRRLDSLRKKLDRQTREVQQGATRAIGEGGGLPGPATLMSRLMREELERQNRGGPVQRFLNRPLVLVTLFLLSVGTLVWTLWPVSAAQLYERGAALMASEDPADWEKGWDRYLEPLEEKYPDHPYRQEVDAFRARVEEQRVERQEATRARTQRRLSEGQWFFEKGMRLRQRGDEKGAREVWQRLIDAYGEVPAERPWARKAEKALEERKVVPDTRAWTSLHRALERARQLADEGNLGEAQAIRKGLMDLYRDDPAARALLEKK